MSVSQSVSSHHASALTRQGRPILGIPTFLPNAAAPRVTPTTPPRGRHTGHMAAALRRSHHRPLLAAVATVLCFAPRCDLVGGQGPLSTLSTLCQARRQLPPSPSKEHIVSSWYETNSSHGNGAFRNDRLTRPAVASQEWELFHTQGGNSTWKGVGKVEAETVKIDLFVNSVWDIDQRTGSFMIQCYLRLQWQDDRLCFNEAELPQPSGCLELDDGNMYNLSTGVSIIEGLWLPDVHFVNSLVSNVQNSDATMLRVRGDGRVLWNRRFIVTLSADFNFQDLPFDRQLLPVDLESFRMSTNDMVLLWNDKVLADTEWEVEQGYTGVAAVLARPNRNPEWCFRRCSKKENGDQAQEDCNKATQKTEKQDDKVVVYYDRSYYAEPFRRDEHRKFSRARFAMYVQRQRGMWEKSYIEPSTFMFCISYMGLYIGNHNPGRPGVHAVTILMHLTIDSSIRSQVCARLYAVYMLLLGIGHTFLRVLPGGGVRAAAALNLRRHLDD
jgi:hypothetical protein